MIDSEFNLELFSIPKHVFSFEKLIPVGQYEFPFTFRLPKCLPNSFSIALQDKDKHAYSIRYTLTAYFESEEPVLHCTIPITVSAGIKDPIRKARSKNLDAMRSQIMNESSVLNQSND